MSRGRVQDAGQGPGRTTFLITQVGSLAASRYAARIAPLGLTAAQSGLLRAVAAQPGRSQQAVAAQLGLLPSRLVALVDELERLELVERRRNTADRRHYALFLTDAGQELLQAVGQVSREHGDDFLAPLDADEREILGRLLGKLAEHHELTPGVHPGYARLGRDEGTPASTVS
jgi:DNA-binding MarR family transcriptional regulator